MNNALDSLTAGLLRFVQDYGVYIILPACYAIILPFAAILASVGYWWPWFFFHTGVSVGIMVLPSLFPGERRMLLRAICYPTAGIVALGILNSTKPFAVLGGMLFGEVSLGLVVILSALARLGYGVAIAPLSSDEEIDIESAQKRAKQLLDIFVSVAAWELFIAWYITSLGMYLSARQAIFAIFAVGVIIYGGIAWKIGGEIGRKLAYYSAATALLLITVYAVYQMLVAHAYISADLHTLISNWLTFNTSTGSSTGVWGRFLIIITIVILGQIGKHVTGRQNVSTYAFYGAGALATLFITAEISSLAHPLLSEHTWAIIVSKLAPENNVNYIRVWFWIGSIITEIMVAKHGLKSHIRVVCNKNGEAVAKQTIKGNIPYAKMLFLFTALLFFDWIWWQQGNIAKLHEYLMQAWGTWST